MKKYKIEITIYEGSDEFWEIIEAKNETGCDEVRALIAEAISNNGFYGDGEYKNCDIKVVSFSDR